MSEADVFLEGAVQNMSETDVFLSQQYKDTTTSNNQLQIKLRKKKHINNLGGISPLASAPLAADIHSC